jgi:hypothetical protein
MVGSNIQFVAAPSNQFPGGHLYGLVISINIADLNNDLDISVGECRSSDNTTDLILTSVLTKRSDAAWAAGTNQGGMDVGSKPTSGTLHVYIISNGSTVDALFSQSASAPTLPGGYTKFRRIGAVTTDGSANIRQFVQVGDRFLYKSFVKDVVSATAVTGGTLFAISVPSGIKVNPIINISVNAGIYWKVYDPDQTFAATFNPSNTNVSATDYISDSYGSDRANFHPFGVMTNTARQIGFDVRSTATNDVFLDTHGFFDNRGRFEP